MRRQHENVACRQRSPRSVPAVFVAAKSLREDLPEPVKGAADRASRPRGVPLSSNFCGAGNLCTHRVSRDLPFWFIENATPPRGGIRTAAHSRVQICRHDRSALSPRP